MHTENLFDETLNLFKDSKSRSNTLGCIRNLLSDEAYRKCFVTHINKLLSISSTRLDGLELVTECIEWISPDVLEEHGSFWMDCWITNYEHSHNKEVYLKTIRNIIEYHQKNSDFSKKIANDFLTRILDISLNGDKDLCIKEASIHCLISCLKYYSSFCKQYKNRIEDYLLAFLESSSERLIEDSGRAIIYCQQIPTSGNNTVSCINNLTLLFRKLCVTCHQCFDEIFENWLETEQFKFEDIKPLNIKGPPPHYNSYLKLQYRTQVIINILEWIIIFFTERPGMIVHNEIFSVFERGLSMHKCLKENSIEAKYSSINLLHIQTKILQVLGVVTISLNSVPFPFYPLISEMIRDLMNKNKSCDCYINCIKFQENLYDVLLNLIIKGHGLEKSLQNALVCQIIKSNTPSEDGVTVKVNSNLAGKTSKTKQKMILDSISSKTNGFSKLFWKKDKIETSCSSLKILPILLKYDILHAETLKKITAFVIQNILLIQKGIIKAPFTNAKSQELLYEILCSVFEQDNHSIYDEYGEQMDKIFFIGGNSENLNISITCNEGLRNMKKTFQALKYSELSNNSESRLTHSEETNCSEIILRETEIKILQNNVLVPAKLERKTTDEMEADMVSVEQGNEFVEDIELPTIMKEDEADVNTSIDLEEKEILTEEYVSIDSDEDLLSEPAPKKSKILFVNKFDEDSD